MSEKRTQDDREFREALSGAWRRPGSRSLRSRVALGVNEGTLGNWVQQAREGRGELAKDDYEELTRLRAENAELRMERDVLKRSVARFIADQRTSYSVPPPGCARTHS